MQYLEFKWFVSGTMRNETSYADHSNFISQDANLGGFCLCFVKIDSAFFFLCCSLAGKLTPALRACQFPALPAPLPSPAHPRPPPCLSPNHPSLPIPRPARPPPYPSPTLPVPSPASPQLQITLSVPRQAKITLSVPVLAGVNQLFSARHQRLPRAVPVPCSQATVVSVRRDPGCARISLVEPSDCLTLRQSGNPRRAIRD